MPADLIAEARARIEQRLAELNDEREAAERALVGLEGVIGSGSSAGRSAPAPKRRRKRARRGQRHKEFIDALREAPGSTVAQVAKNVGTVSNPYYALARQLVKDGAIEKQGAGYRIAETPAAKKPGRPRKAGKSKRSAPKKRAGKAKAGAKTKRGGRAEKAVKARRAKAKS